MEVLQSLPAASSFTPLAEHQSRTPESFYGGAPILHYHSARCKVVVLESDLAASPALNTLRGGASNANGLSSAGQESAEGKEIVLENVDVFVASDKFRLYRSEAGSGIALPYPLISLHAIQRFHLPDTPADEQDIQGLYMQIAKPADETGAEEDEEEDSITLTIVPPPVTEEIASEEIADTKTEETATYALFAAVSACSNLHPDPIAQGEEEDDNFGDADEQPGVGGIIFPGATDGGLPPPLDGSSGWITAENMHEYFDEEGNWIADGEPPASIPGLGPGAGHVHARNDEDNDEAENGTHPGEDEETKWRRTA